MNSNLGDDVVAVEDAALNQMKGFTIPCAYLVDVRGCANHALT